MMDMTFFYSMGLNFPTTKWAIKVGRFQRFTTVRAGMTRHFLGAEGYLSRFRGDSSAALALKKGLPFFYTKQRNKKEGEIMV